MRHVNRPNFNAEVTFSTCISRVRNPTTRRELHAILPDIKNAETDYIQMAEAGNLYRIPQINNIGGVSCDELNRTYTSRMATKGQPGRQIYDHIKLLPDDDCCPFCGHRNISSVDHFLPKRSYPIFSVTPVNLVASCSDCNKSKLNLSPISANETLLHPYFDEVTNTRWLIAEVIEQTPAAVTFDVISVDEWSNTLNNRIEYHFRLLGLTKLYSCQAAREIADIRNNMQRHFDSGGSDAVRRELDFQWKSRKANYINSWQTATYEALSISNWFCDGGFADA